MSPGLLVHYALNLVISGHDCETFPEEDCMKRLLVLFLLLSFVAVPAATQEEPIPPPRRISAPKVGLFGELHDVGIPRAAEVDESLLTGESDSAIRLNMAGVPVPYVNVRASS